MARAAEHGVGIAVLPDYVVQPESGLVRLLQQADMPEMDCFLVYAEEMKTVARAGFSRFPCRRGATLEVLKYGGVDFRFRGNDDKRLRV